MISRIAITFGRENSVMVRGKIFCLQPLTHEAFIEMDHAIHAENSAEATLEISICQTITLDDREGATCYFLSPNIKLVKFTNEIM
jgi:hypothetical protein